MLKSLLFSSLLLITPALLAKDTAHRTALKKLLDQSKEKFKTKGCQKLTLNPAELFGAIHYKTSFSERCDLQGEVAIKLFVPFAINFQVKNISHYQRITGTAKLNLGMENPPKLLAELTKAKLQGKDTIFFNAFYSGEVLPASTLKIKPGSESIRIEIMDKDFGKKLEEFTIHFKNNEKAL